MHARVRAASGRTWLSNPSAAAAAHCLLLLSKWVVIALLCARIEERGLVAAIAVLHAAAALAVAAVADTDVRGEGGREVGFRWRPWLRKRQTGSSWPRCYGSKLRRRLRTCI